MSVIQRIRDKYARIAVIAIALALLGFILMDALVGRNRGLFSRDNSNIIGRVNGRKITATDFDNLVKDQEENLKRQQYYQGGEVGRQQAIEAAWNQEIARILLVGETDKLGMKIGKKELNDMLFGTHPHDYAKQYLGNPQTGEYDPAFAQQTILDIRKSNDPVRKNQLNALLNAMELGRINDKFTSLISNTINYPRWFLEKQNADNSQLAKFSMVREVYSSIADSTVKVSDKEIQDFISKHKEDYKQEETRSIAFVKFSAAPTAKDTAATRADLLRLKPEFDTTRNAENFLVRNGESNFFNGYISKSEMQVAAKDSITSLPLNAVYGPYPDGSSFVLAKLLEVKTLPDSVKCRHILIASQSPSGQAVDDSVAKQRADSIAAAIRNGANFDSLETKYSDDKNAHKDKGVMTFSSGTIQGENFAKEFAQFILFDGKPGDKKVVKTQFGWHYIEILAFIKPEPHYKVAYLARPIEASSETDQMAKNEANKFAGNSRNLKSFDENYDKELKPKGILKNVATDIKPTDYMIQSLGPSRQLVREIYDVKKGDVVAYSQPIANSYVVAVVTEVNDEGTQSATAARGRVEPLLRNKKKAEMLKQKIGKVSTLEAASAALGKPIELVDSVRMTAKPVSMPVYEPRVNGAAFNPANNGKVVPEALEGSNGVYVIRVEAVTATAVANANIEELRKSMYQQGKQSAMYNSPIAALRNAATIKDNRAVRY